MAPITQPSQTAYASMSIASQIPKMSAPIDPIPMTMLPICEIDIIRAALDGTSAVFQPEMIRLLNRTSAATSNAAAIRWSARIQSVSSIGAPP